MSELNYIKWVGANKTDTFTSGALQVEHIFRATAQEGGAPGTIVHTIKVSNISDNNVLLKDVDILVDLDDTGTRWDAYLCNIQAQPIDPLGETLSFGDITSGESNTKTYRWTASSLAGSVEEDFEISFNLIPTYKVVHTKSNALSSGCKVTK